MSQAEVEARFFNRVEQIRRGEMLPEKAFAEESEWTTELGGVRFLLHPRDVRWLVYDGMHDEWYDTPYGPGEALLVAEDGRPGAVQLPAPPAGQMATAGDWCLVADSARKLGVARSADVRRAQAEGWLPPGARVWSGAVGQWQSVAAFAGPAGSPPPGARRPDWLAPLPEPATVTPPRVASAPAAHSPAVAPPPATPGPPPVGFVPPPPAAPGQHPSFCGQCGARLGPQVKFCTSCGAQVSAG